MDNIRLARLDDINKIKNIIDEGISENYYSLDVIKSFIEDDNSYLLVAVSDEDIPLAAMFCEKGTLKDMSVLENIPYPNDAFNSYSDETLTVVYKTVATSKNARRKGYVHALFNEYDKIFKNTEHDLRIGLALILPDGSIPIKKHIDEVGFEYKKIIKHPWSKIRSYCSYCKNDFCMCDGMLILKENKIEKKV